MQSAIRGASCIPPPGASQFADLFVQLVVDHDADVKQEDIIDILSFMDPPRQRRNLSAHGASRCDRRQRPISLHSLPGVPRRYPMTAATRSARWRAFMAASPAFRRPIWGRRSAI